MTTTPRYESQKQRTPHIGPTSPMRICFLINSMEGGGAERAMATLLTHLLPTLVGHEIELILLDKKEMCQNLPSNLKVTTLDSGGRLVRSLAALARHWASSEQRPDVCLSYLARANVVNSLLSMWCGHTALVSERVNASSHFAVSRAAPILKWITRNSYRHADQVIAVSPGVAKDLSNNFSVPCERLSVIGNIVDVEQLSDLSGAPSTLELPQDFFLGMGRLVPNKNFSLLLEAYSLVPKAPPLVLLGEGPEKMTLHAQAKALGIDQKVHFLGFVKNPYPIVAKARALVSASRAEGFPNTLVEACALGCPVIATDCPSGPADVLEAIAERQPPWSHTAHGILVPMEDRDAMAAAILTLCDDSARSDYSDRAKKRSLSYSKDAVVSAYRDLLVAKRTDTLSPLS